MLVLFHEKQDSDFKSSIYNLTLRYLSERLSRSSELVYTNSEALIETIKARNVSRIITTKEISYKDSLIVKGLGIVLITIGYTEVLSETADLVIDPLAKSKSNFFAGTRYLIPEILNQLPLEQLAKEVDIDTASIANGIKNSSAESDILSIVNLFEKLNWDSQFFEMNVGFVSCFRLTPNIQKHIWKFVKDEGIDLLQYLCDCHDRESVATAEKNGYSFVDIRLTFERVLKNKVTITPRDGFEVRQGVLANYDGLEDFVSDSYKLSRYYFDLNFDRKKVLQFYTGWLKKAFLGEFDDYVFVLYHLNKPIGFCTIREKPQSAAQIGLFGINPSYSNNGMGNFLLKSALNLLLERGISYSKVVTQGRNYNAQRLYQRCGFVSSKTELWYHKWFI